MYGECVVYGSLFGKIAYAFLHASYVHASSAYCLHILMNNAETPGGAVIRREIQNAMCTYAFGAAVRYQRDLR